MISTRIDQAQSTPFSLQEDGSLLASARPTRAGVFVYMVNGVVVKEFRSPEEVFKAESLATLDGRYVVINHPSSTSTDGLLTVDNSALLQHGTVYNVRQDAENPGWVAAQVRLTSPEAIAQVRDGMVSLSAGYTSKVIPTPGLEVIDPVTGLKVIVDACQTEIAYNHLALVDAGRAGPGARILLDAAENVGIQVIQLDSMQEVKMDVIEEREGKFVVLSTTGEVLGTHETKEQAEEQLRAVEASKAKKDECLETIAPKEDVLPVAPAEAPPEVKSDSADIQLKLDSATVALTELQVKCDAATSALTELQAKFDAINTELARVTSDSFITSKVDERIATQAIASQHKIKFDGQSLDSVKRSVVQRAHPTLKLDSFSSDQISQLFGTVVSPTEIRADSLPETTAAITIKSSAVRVDSFWAGHKE